MSKSKEVELTIVSQEERMDDDFVPPTGFFVINASGDGVFFHTRSRSVAQTESDKIYGEGKYKVRAVVKAQTR